VLNFSIFYVTGLVGGSGSVGFGVASRLSRER